MTNPIPPVRVDIVEGDNTAVPGLQRTGDAIANVAAGASGGLSPIQKLSKAMVLSEGREGSLVLRELRGAVTGLGAEAIGAAGPLGRLGVTLAEFGVGGGIGLAVVAGMAAIGFAIKETAGASDELIEHLEAAHQRLQHLIEKAGGQNTDEMRATFQRRIDEAKQQLDSLQRAPVVQPMQTTFGEGNIGEGVAHRIGDAASERILQIEALREKISSLTNELGTMGLEAGGTADAAARRVRDLFEGGRKRSMLELADPFGKQAGDAMGKAFIERTEHTLPDFLGFTKHGPNVNENIFGLFEGGRKRSALDLASPFGKQAGDEMGKAFIEKSLQKPGTDAARVANDSVALITAFQGGSAGGALSAASALLGGIKGVPTPISLGLGLAGSLLDGFAAERRHQEIIRELRLLREKAQLGPTQIRPIFIDSRGNPAQTAYEVGRLQDRDAIPRGVGGP